MHENFLMRNMRETGQPDACPRATQDLELNLSNRQNALDNKMYGPANPQLDESGANQDFWQRFADQRQGDSASDWVPGGVGEELPQTLTRQWQD